MTNEQFPRVPMFRDGTSARHGIRRSPSTSERRRRLARAIRGPIPRFDVSARSLDRRLGSLPSDVRALLVEAFARQETETERKCRALSRAGRRAMRNDKVKGYYDELRAAGVRHEAAERMAEGLVDPVRSS